MRCKACNKEANEKGFCVYHHGAYLKVMEAYKMWKRAYGELTWEDFLDRLEKNEYTGQWVRDILGIMREKHDKGKN